MPAQRAIERRRRISPTAEATIPLKDDGLYRGDGAFEVIRLYGGRPFALGDTSTGSSARRRRSELALTAPPWSARSRRCWPSTARTRRTSPDRHPRRPPDRARRAASRHADRRSRRGHVPAATVPERPEVALLRGQHAGHAVAKRGAPTRRCWSRPDGAVLEAPTSTHLLGLGRGRTLRTTELGGGILDSITRERRSWRCRSRRVRLRARRPARPPRGLSGLVAARGPAGVLARRAPYTAVPGPRTEEATPPSAGAERQLGTWTRPVLRRPRR